MTHAANRMALTEWCAALYVCSILLFSFRGGLTIVTQACGFLFIAAFLYEVMFRAPRFAFSVPLPLGCFFAFMLYSFLSLIETNESLSMIVTLLLLFVSSLFMVNLILHAGHVRYLTYGFVASLLIATYQVWKELGGFTVKNGWDRISSFAGNANVFAIALFIGIILCAEQLANKETGGSRSLAFRAVSKSLYLLLILLFAYEILFLAGSRKAMIGLFLFGFFYFLRMLVKVKFLAKFAILAAGAGVLAGLYAMMRQSVFFERFSRALDMLTGSNVVEGSLNERADMIGTGLALWERKPWFGWGTDQFRYLSGYQTYSHNNYVELLSNNGLVGLILYYSMMVTLLGAGLRLLLGGNDRQKHYGWLNVSVVLILIFWDFALVSYYSKLQWFTLSVLIGLTYHAYRLPGTDREPAAAKQRKKETERHANQADALDPDHERGRSATGAGQSLAFVRPRAD
ncbi:O-antigen ligase family protein [Cohnella caldifontis]|uniref:O-antigen ligase family protein n=1 Tax=Cohnella caldifontis TaxID=3027471 RepID=UPI0023EB50EE|nr:O-antigen ligase family protein [Cohnella sp. YIM B05605]